MYILFHSSGLNPLICVGFWLHPHPCTFFLTVVVCRTWRAHRPFTWAPPGSVRLPASARLFSAAGSDGESYLLWFAGRAGPRASCLAGLFMSTRPDSGWPPGLEFHGAYKAAGKCGSGRLRGGVSGPKIGRLHIMWHEGRPVWHHQQMLCHVTASPDPPLCAPARPVVSEVCRLDPGLRAGTPGHQKVPPKVPKGPATGLQGPSDHTVQSLNQLGPRPYTGLAFNLALGPRTLCSPQLARENLFRAQEE